MSSRSAIWVLLSSHDLWRITPARRHARNHDDHAERLEPRTGRRRARELLTACLASCLAGTYAVQATARGIELRSIDIQLQARTDMAAFLGLRGDVRPGIQQITATVTIGTEADDQALAEITGAVTRLSDIYMLWGCSSPAGFLA
jgi:OsmC-like protein